MEKYEQLVGFQYKGTNLSPGYNQTSAHSQHVLITTTTFATVTFKTLARWTTSVRHTAGIDISYFKPYYMHSASTSKQAQISGNLEQVLKMDTWWQTSTISKYYLRQVKYFCHDERASGLNASDLAQTVPNFPLRKTTKFCLAKDKQNLLQRPCKVPLYWKPTNCSGLYNRRPRWSCWNSIWYSSFIFSSNFTHKHSWLWLHWLCLCTHSWGQHPPRK